MVDAIHLMRHGLVENPGQIRYGQLPGYRLSARGREQARLAGEHLRSLARPIARIVASPLERAVETATIVQEVLGLPAISTDARLIEPENAFDGLIRTAVLGPRHWPKLWNPFRPSWGEPFREVVARMHAVIHELRGEPGVLLVTHQAPIWIARQAFRSSGPPWLAPVRCTQASITSLRFDGDRYRGDWYWRPAVP